MTSHVSQNQVENKDGSILLDLLVFFLSRIFENSQLWLLQIFFLHLSVFLFWYSHLHICYFFGNYPTYLIYSVPFLIFFSLHFRFVSFLLTYFQAHWLSLLISPLKIFFFISVTVLFSLISFWFFLRVSIFPITLPISSCGLFTFQLELLAY